MNSIRILYFGCMRESIIRPAAGPTPLLCLKLITLDHQKLKPPCFCCGSLTGHALPRARQGGCIDVLSLKGPYLGLWRSVLKRNENFLFWLLIDRIFLGQKRLVFWYQNIVARVLYSLSYNQNKEFL